MPLAPAADANISTVIHTNITSCGVNKGRKAPSRIRIVLARRRLFRLLEQPDTGSGKFLAHSVSGTVSMLRLISHIAAVEQGASTFFSVRSEQSLDEVGIEIPRSKIRSARIRRCNGMGRLDSFR